MQVPSQRGEHSGGFLDLIPDEERKRLLASCQVMTYRFGDTIIREGEEGDAVYIILTGQARVVQGEGAGEVFLTRIGAGDVIGEAAALSHERRNATVRASGDVTALRLPGEQLQLLMQQYAALHEWVANLARARALHSFLRRTSSFARLPGHIVRQLVLCLVPVSVAKGERPILEGDSAEAMFIVQRGKLRMLMTLPNGDRKVVGYLRDGDFCAEAPVLRGGTYDATVEAITAAELLRLDRSAVLDLVASSPEFRRAVDERIASYSAEGEARLPLDFAREMVPTRRPPPMEIEESPPASQQIDHKLHPFASPEGRFRKTTGHIRLFPIVMQVDEMDCGAACLAMVFRHYGKTIGLARIRKLAHVSADGTSLRSLTHAATELGLAARRAKVSPSNIDLMPLPAIIHWDEYHWVVLYGIDSKYAYIADPAVGKTKVSRQELQKRWSGYAAMFDYTKEFERNENDASSSRWIWPHLSPYLGVFSLVLFLAILSAALTLVMPILTQVVVDRVVVEGAYDVLDLVVIAMVAIFVFQTLGNVIQSYMLGFVAVRVDASMLDFLARRLLSLPTSYFRARRTGDIERRLEGVRTLRQTVVSSGISGILAGIRLVVAVLLMTLYSAKLTLVFVAAAPFYGALLWTSAKLITPLFNRLEDETGKHLSDQQDAIKGIESIKAYGAEAAFRERLLDRLLRLARERLRADYTVLGYQSVIDSVGFFMNLLFLWGGARLALGGSLSLGGFVAFTSLVSLATSPLGTLLKLWDSVQYAKIILERLADVVEAEPEQGWDRSRLQPVKSLSGAISLKNLVFRYGGPGSPNVIDGIDLEVAPGTKLAIVGRSGCGKSTLVKLLSGMLEPTEGSILYDGVDLTSLNYRDLRRNIGFVLQESVIFAGSVADNISLGEDQDSDRVSAAAQAAAAHEFITRLPRGYQTIVGESGLALSGGQKQRIAIARALYRNPSIFLFDEATSALDTDSERAVQENVQALFAGRTAFVIAHRISTIRDADRILVMERGRIVESGTHDELMDRRGIYFYLVSRQLES